jgi:hypothetical protein
VTGTCRDFGVGPLWSIQNALAVVLISPTTQGTGRGDATGLDRPDSNLSEGSGRSDFLPIAVLLSDPVSAQRELMRMGRVANVIAFAPSRGSPADFLAP